MAIYTVGHGARSLDEFLSVLRTVPIELLIDVRMFPGSRRHPHFGRDVLNDSLTAHDIGYDWRGEALGGRRKGTESSRHAAWRNDSFRAYADHMETRIFRSALAELKEQAAQGTTLAVMCAETLWWRCHRRLIADALTVSGVEVLHLIDEGKPQPHKLNEALRLDEAGTLVYDVGAGDQLPLTPPDA